MRLEGLAATVLLLSAPAVAAAHHSVAAVYDREKAVSFSGRLTRIEFVNPHSKMEVEFTGKDGRPVRWTIETSSPNGMERLGLNKESLAVGDSVKVVGYPARSGGTEAWLTRLETSQRSYDVGFRRSSPAPTPTPLN
jgi:hypothetical protein